MNSRPRLAKTFLLAFLAGGFERSMRLSPIGNMATVRPDPPPLDAFQFEASASRQNASASSIDSTATPRVE